MDAQPRQLHIYRYIYEQYYIGLCSFFNFEIAYSKVLLVYCAQAKVSLDDILNARIHC